MKKKLLAAALGAAMGLGMYAAPADAHGVFFANRVDTKALVLGEGPLDNAYDPACVQRIDAYDVNFQPTTVERVDGEKNVMIVPAVNPLTLRRGDTLRLRIYKDGQPYANAPVIADVLGDLTTETQADANGYVNVRVANNGLNVIGVEVGFPTDDANVTKKIFSSLSFILPAE